jgi:hypothetical protein
MSKFNFFEVNFKFSFAQQLNIIATSCVVTYNVVIFTVTVTVQPADGTAC